jgi:hypothetical protein
MYLRCIILFLLLAGSAYGDAFETIRQQFEIYQRYVGELEILRTNDLKEIDNVLKRTSAKRLLVRKALDKALSEDAPKNLPSPLFVDDYTAPFFHYVVVERAVIRRALQQGKMDDVMVSIVYVYRLTDLLADSGMLELRITAARIRLQMLESVQSILFNTHR